MNKLELLLLQFKRVWEEMGISPETMDEIIDSIVYDFDLSKITDEKIIETTKKYLEYKKEKK